MDNNTSLNTTGETQTNVGAETPEAKEVSKKTFSQEDVNAIIADRLKSERNKYSDYDELKEKAKLTLVSATSIVEGGYHDVMLKK